MRNTCDASGPHRSTSCCAEPYTRPGSHYLIGMNNGRLSEENSMSNSLVCPPWDILILILLQQLADSILHLIRTPTLQSQQQMRPRSRVQRQCGEMNPSRPPKYPELLQRPCGCWSRVGSSRPRISLSPLSVYLVWAMTVQSRRYLVSRASCSGFTPSISINPSRRACPAIHCCTASSARGCLSRRIN